MAWLYTYNKGVTMCIPCDLFDMTPAQRKAYQDRLNREYEERKRACEAEDKKSADEKPAEPPKPEGDRT